MALAPRLAQKQTQSLVMTPQLQQAIKLLQLSNIELAAFVEEQLEQNPLLERGTGEENRRGEDQGEATETAKYDEVNLDGRSGAADDAIDAPSDAQFDDDSPPMTTTQASQAADVGGSVDWSKSSGSGGSFNALPDYDAASNSAAELTLADILSEQLILACKDERDVAIGRYLIDLVDENGYMREDPAEIAQRLGISELRVRSMITLMQSFEPSGVMAANLQDCLAIQLRERGALTPGMQALLDNLRLLAGHDLSKLIKLCSASREELDAMIKTLRGLAPKPGLIYGGTAAAAVEPDVFVRKLPSGAFAVELNSETLPRVLVNSRYYAEICSLSKDEAVREFMSECHASASWLVKSLDQRARTILKVASEIIRQQDGFFAFGIDHLRPLNLKQVADAIDMHESTVSRVTTNKFMATPRGTFELKYFFTTAIPSLSGEEGVSAEAVRHKIQILIDEETADNVMSDDRIVELLRAQGIDIARRTVAKYREAMGIQSSVQRRRKLKAGL